MSQVVLSKCLVTEEIDWIPIVLKEEYISQAYELGIEQKVMSKERNLRDRSIDKSEKAAEHRNVFGKYAEFAVKQWAGDVARVTLPGEFHDWPDVGQVNVRFIGDSEDGLMIHDGDQGELPMVLCTVKDVSFKDKTIWLVGWGMTDHLRRHIYLINLFRPNKEFGSIGTILPHEQFVYPRKMLYPMKTLSKEFVNIPYIK